jgi:hypothetical protein
MLGKIREIKERQGVSSPAAAASGDYRIDGIEVLGPEAECDRKPVPRRNSGQSSRRRSRLWKEPR